MTKPIRWKWEGDWSAWTHEFAIKTATNTYKIVAVVKYVDGFHCYNLFRGYKTTIPIGGGRASTIDDCKYHAAQMVKAIQKQHNKKAYVAE